MEKNRKRLLKREFLPGWRTRERRRWLVLLVIAGLFLFFVGLPTGRPVATVAGLLLYGISAIMVRIATRGIADHTDAALDERQLQVRNAAYLHAYRVVGAGIAMLAALLVFWRALGLPGPVMTDWLEQGLMTLLFAALCGPSCVVAWTEKES
jgi:hypothetical protein